jgi:NADPH:quinone reductase-like Zn-dependent oxidoreductase
VDLGHEVVTTSSPASLDWVSGHGAKVVVDHTKPAGEVIRELKANGPFTGGVFDVVDTPPVTALLTSLLADLEGGGKYFTVFPLLPNSPPLPPNIKRVFTSYYHAFTKDKNKELGNWTYETYILQGLKKGWIIPTRVEKVVGGLGAVQGVMNKMAKGMTGGRKFIVEPSEK